MTLIQRKPRWTPFIPDGRGGYDSFSKTDGRTISITKLKGKFCVTFWQDNPDYPPIIHTSPTLESAMAFARKNRNTNRFWVV